MAERTKRYDQYPQLATMARGMTNDGVALVLAWHTVLLHGLTGFIAAFGPEARRRGWDEREAVGGQDALRQWLGVMQEAASVLGDRRAADWCCKRGMEAHPDLCPQHPAPVPGATREGRDGAQVFLAATDMTPAGWYKIGAYRGDS
jgi:hypothetical protein